MRRVGALVIAAGASTRMGEPKQLLRLGDETLLERAVRVATQAGLSPVLVLLGSSAERIQQGSRLGGARIVNNPDWQEGMAASIRIGIVRLLDLEESAECAGVVVMVCDMPAVTAAHLRALTQTGEVLASAYAGLRGVPAYLPRSSFALLQSLHGDSGARDLLQSAAAIDLPDGEFDVDTPEDLQAARARFEERGTQDEG